MAKLVVALCAVLVAPAVNSYVPSELRGTAGQRVAESTQRNGTAVGINDNPGTELEDEVGSTIGNISNKQTDVLPRRTAKFLTSPGKPGKDGPRGTKGSAGKDGPRGEDGEPGLAKGPKGDQGLPGNMGAPGVPGDMGDAGPQGIKGPKGELGQKGPKGAQGNAGNKGPKGIKGPPI